LLCLMLVGCGIMARKERQNQMSAAVAAKDQGIAACKSQYPDENKVSLIDPDSTSRNDQNGSREAAYAKAKSKMKLLRGLLRGSCRLFAKCMQSSRLRDREMPPREAYRRVLLSFARPQPALL
jgi:hypothetical protein